MDMNEFYRSFVPGEEQKRIQALEPFDEFEVGLPWCVQNVEREARWLAGGHKTKRFFLCSQRVNRVGWRQKSLFIWCNQNMIYRTLVKS